MKVKVCSRSAEKMAEKCWCLIMKHILVLAIGSGHHKSKYLTLIFVITESFWVHVLAPTFTLTYSSKGNYLTIFFLWLLKFIHILFSLIMISFQIQILILFIHLWAPDCDAFVDCISEMQEDAFSNTKPFRSEETESSKCKNCLCTTEVQLTL